MMDIQFYKKKKYNINTNIVMDLYKDGLYCMDLYKDVS